MKEIDSLRQKHSLEEAEKQVESDHLKGAEDLIKKQDYEGALKQLDKIGKHLLLEKSFKSEEVHNLIKKKIEEQEEKKQ